MAFALAPSASALGGLLQIAIRQQSRLIDTREYYPFGKAFAYLLLISFSFIRFMHCIILLIFAKVNSLAIKKRFLLDFVFKSRLILFVAA